MAQPIINVYDLPNQVAAESLAGSTVIVLDVLRATSTICQALASGATDVVPFRSIEEAFDAAEKEGRERVVLGGERRGLKIEGFDLGNSPTEYTPEAVGGRRVFITTTNGTQALHHARLARRVLVGAFVNLSSVVETLRDEERVDIVCAGTDGHATGEDMLAAGAIVVLLREYTKGRGEMNDEAAFAENAWDKMRSGAVLRGETLSELLALSMRETKGGRNCIEVGNSADIPFCAQIDLLRVVPRLNTQEWKITGC
jgi:2-phosphosulfolactate phosphatase